MAEKRSKIGTYILKQLLQFYCKFVKSCVWTLTVGTIHLSAHFVYFRASIVLLLRRCFIEFWWHSALPSIPKNTRFSLCSDVASRLVQIGFAFGVRMCAEWIVQSHSAVVESTDQIVRSWVQSPHPFKCASALNIPFVSLQIEFDTHVSRSIRVVTKELPSIEEKVANVTGNPEVIIIVFFVLICQNNIIWSRSVFI